MMLDPVGYLVVGLFAIGMALAFFGADRRSPTSRALALMLALLGVAALLNIAMYDSSMGVEMPTWRPIFAVLETGIMIAGLEWLVRIGRTELFVDREMRRGERLLRVAQGLAIVYGLAGTLLPSLRQTVWNVSWTPARLSQPAYYLFAIPFGGALSLGAVRIVQLVRGPVDRAEWQRLVALVVATVLWSTAISAPMRWKPLSFALGEIALLIGAIRYHVLQGQRGQFLARFLSPQVVRVVQERGLQSALERTRRELSIVACDLRGFTGFAETAEPEEVIRLLEGYYGAVGAVVARFDGSIKDFAGDGILALVGAPLAHADHARRAVTMALELRDRVTDVLAHWRQLGLDIGVGVGVATGFVTVGVIDATGRLEYAAVGPVVNLAARLCARAASGQVLAEPHAVAGARSPDDGVAFRELGAFELKGVARPVAIFEVERMR